MAGERDILANNALEMKYFAPNVSLLKVNIQVRTIVAVSSILQIGR